MAAKFLAFGFAVGGEVTVGWGGGEDRLGFDFYVGASESVV